MGLSTRRFTRLANAFGKKLENHMAAVALHFTYYNLLRIHQSLHPPITKDHASDGGWRDDKAVGRFGYRCLT